MTVDELARAAGITTRQVRALQTRGLLPHPELVGRTGYYDQGHLERVRAVAALQAEGFSLAAVATLLRAWEQDMTLAQVLGLSAHVDRGRDGPSHQEEPDVFADLAGPIGVSSMRRGSVLSLVPSTILDHAAAS